MPTVAISTLAEDGTTTIGAYSLVFPYYIAGKDSYAMLLECRNSSNTAQNILRTGKCALNFIKDDKKSFKEWWNAHHEIVEYDEKGKPKLWRLITNEPDEELEKKYKKRNEEIEKYRDEMKNEAFDLLKKYFYHLWD